MHRYFITVTISYTSGTQPHAYSEPLSPGLAKNSN
jgi:hypothetical protein